MARDLSKLFFNVMSYLSGQHVRLDDKVKQIVEEEHKIASKHFTEVLDLSCFRGNDYETVRKFLVDWYTAGRTIVRLHRCIFTESYELDDESTVEYIKSLGFFFPDYVPKRFRNMFLLQLANLYKVKGSPQSVLELIKFANYLDFKLFEYWLVAENESSRIYDTQYIYDSKSVEKQLWFIGKQVGRMLEKEEPEEIRHTYDNFAHKLDAHWYHNKEDIITLDNNLEISLPSLTPYIGLLNFQNITKKWLPANAILSRLVKQQYELWQRERRIVRNIYFEYLDIDISVLELCLCLWWTFYVTNGFVNPLTNELDVNKFYTLTPDHLKKHICYVVDLANELDVAQFQEDFDRLFNQAPENRQEWLDRLREREEKFTHPNNYSILPDPRDIATLLAALNHDLFNRLQVIQNDDISCSILTRELWFEISAVLGGIDASLTVVPTLSNFEHIYTLMNFFKPIHTRLATVGTILDFTDKVGDCIRGEDVQLQYILQRLYDTEKSDDYLDFLITLSKKDKQELNYVFNLFIEQLLQSHHVQLDSKNMSILESITDNWFTYPMYDTDYAYDVIRRSILKLHILHVFSDKLFFNLPNYDTNYIYDILCSDYAAVYLLESISEIYSIDLKVPKISFQQSLQDIYDVIQNSIMRSHTLQTISDKLGANLSDDIVTYIVESLYETYSIDLKVPKISFQNLLYDIETSNAIPKYTFREYTKDTFTIDDGVIYKTMIYTFTDIVQKMSKLEISIFNDNLISTLQIEPATVDSFDKGGFFDDLPGTEFYDNVLIEVN